EVALLKSFDKPGPVFGQNLVYECHAVHTTSKLRQELGLRPRYTLASALAHTWAWYTREGLVDPPVDFAFEDTILAQIGAAAAAPSPRITPSPARRLPTLGGSLSLAPCSRSPCAPRPPRRPRMWRMPRSSTRGISLASSCRRRRGSAGYRTWGRASSASSCPS